MLKLKGIAASQGIAIGRAYCLGEDEFSIPKRKISYEEISREIYRMEEALIDTRKEIVTIQDKISKELGFSEAKIFEAHLLVLEDRVLIEDVIKQIKSKKVNVEFAFSRSIKKYTDALLNFDDEYLKERAIDIKDIGKRVLRKLLKRDTDRIYNIKEKVIIVTHDLSPADTAVLPKDKIIGFATDIGGSTSHTAIIARTLGIPAVVGLDVLTKHTVCNEMLIVDGSEGVVVVRPLERTIKSYQKKLEQIRKIEEAIHVPRAFKPKTVDGKEVIVSANIELPEELPLIKHFGAEGVGLYRTEYIFLGRNKLPSEEEQFKAYFNVAKTLKPSSVIIRTMDVGGDKFLSRPEMPHEFTPFLGWRAIRFCLARPDIFKVQLRAILRASVEKNIQIMFPMISGISELREAKRLLDECRGELKKEGRYFDNDIKIGVMIEVPSAALTADALAKECDFFSIGTNDLIQYSLAVDRANEKVAYLYEPAHPAVLRLIKDVISSAHKNNIWVGMCGEMAGEIIFAFLLLGLGLDELSMPPPRIPKIKELIRKIRLSDAKDAASKVIDFSTSAEIERYLQDYLRNILKGDSRQLLGA
ncbi:MAG: phosphoenolpyruvate--protein phosphotransferase [Candidatus Omnitrophica bacterium 4484_171]|nr:MAG: phosphoenolpyruvate--protein phosphotransferase [Candidatus Omnitrophica bacterium 4484_171]